MNIRKAVIDDLSELVRLESIYFHNPWTNDQFKYELEENVFSTTLVIEEENKLIGYINYWITFDNATLNKICVDEDYRKQGLAQKLIDLFEEDCKKNDCMVETLEVRVSNEPAKSLYMKNGFTAVTTKKGYYNDGEDALYMVKGVY
jgi:ribosomal-protein-alanine N-acetyltransferase